ncbi:MAG: hypothetical protein ACK46C_07025 [Flavobacteriales bacterium]|jgi:hypothetical protein
MKEIVDTRRIRLGEYYAGLREIQTLWKYGRVAAGVESSAVLKGITNGIGQVSPIGAEKQAPIDIGDVRIGSEEPNITRCASNYY